MASDLVEALSGVMVVMFMGVGVLFVWETIRVTLYTQDGEPTLKDLIRAFFKPTKFTRPSPMPPSSKIKAPTLLQNMEAIKSNTNDQLSMV
ncbi:hypothetical protein CsatB_024700 [Cannabis sativa]